MRVLARTICVIILSMAAHNLAHAQPVLWVLIKNLEDHPMPNIRLGTEGPGSTAVSDANGHAKIILAPQTKPGSWVTLQVLTKNYEFVSPYDNRVLVPPFENRSENYVPVFLVTIGDRKALESGKFAIALAAKFNTTLRSRLKAEESTDKARQVALTEVARSFGLAPGDVDRATGIWKWYEDRGETVKEVQEVDCGDKACQVLVIRQSPDGTLKKSREKFRWDGKEWHFEGMIR